MLLLGCAGAQPATAGALTAKSAASVPTQGAAASPREVAEESETSASPDAPAPDDDADEPEVVGDETEEADETREPEVEAAPRAHPLDGWDSARLREAARHDLAALGSISLGSPSAGALINGVRPDGGELFTLVDPAHAYGTSETVQYLTAAVRRVHDEFPETAPLALGHISAARGGPLRPHISHQAGRDVDISFYYATECHWYARATEQNLDFARTWAFIRALITDTDVEMILIDQAVQDWIRRYALERGEDPTWVDGLFHGHGGKHAIIRHAPGHATHIHVRFYNPIAQETARRAHAALVAEHILPELVAMQRYRAHKGDTLAKIAKRFAVSVPAIKQANALHSNRIREDREYRIPLRGKPVPAPGARLKFPPRRLPPHATAPHPISG